MKTIDLSNDQLALLNGTAEVEVMTLEEMQGVAGTGPYGTPVVCTNTTHYTYNAYGQVTGSYVVKVCK